MAKQLIRNRYGDPKNKKVSRTIHTFRKNRIACTPMAKGIEFVATADGTIYPTEEKKKVQVRKSCDVIIEVTGNDGEKRTLRGLLDTGCTKSIALKHVVKKDELKVLPKADSVKYKIYNQVFESRGAGTVEFKLLDFSNTKTITWDCQVDMVSNPKLMPYDLIIGSDLMSELGMIINYKKKVIEWDDIEFHMGEHGVAVPSNGGLHQTFYMDHDGPLLQQMEKRMQKMVDSDYSKVDIDEMCKDLDLSEELKSKLIKSLKKFPTLFGGGLGNLKGIPPVDIELVEGAKPYHCKQTYSVAKAYEGPTRREILRLCRIGVFREVSHWDNSEWGAPTFVQVKKTGDPRILTDFRKLNKFIKRQPFPIPKIGDLIQKMESFESATAIDLSRGYYTIPLSEASQKLTTMVTPWAKYAYTRLPMGISSAVDIFQSIMSNIFHDLDYVLVYLDDLLLIRKKGESEDDHLKKMEEVLGRLEAHGFRANLRKSFFMQKEIEYLGYLLTPDGLKPQRKKILKNFRKFITQ